MCSHFSYKVCCIRIVKRACTGMHDTRSVKTHCFSGTHIVFPDDHHTCMYYDHSPCMYYEHSTCMYYDHSTYVYYDHSTCEYFLLEGRDWRVELIQIRRVGGRRTPDRHYSPFSNNSSNFIWLGGVRSDPLLPNKKTVFYLSL